MNYSEAAWTRLRAWATRISGRDVTDEARRWADDDAAMMPTPQNVGEWKASMAMAFEAGRTWERSEVERLRCLLVEIHDAARDALLSSSRAKQADLLRHVHALAARGDPAVNEAAVVTREA